MNKRFFGNAGIFLGANIINAGIPFLLLPFLTRALTPADYGVVAMFGIMVNIFGTLTGLSVHGAIGVRYFELEKSVLARYVGACVGILVVSTAVVFALVAIFGKWLVAPTSLPYEWLLIAVLISGLQFLINIKLTLWQVRGVAKKYGVFQVSQGLVNAAVSLILIFGFLMAWEGRVLGQVVATSIFGVLALSGLFLSAELSRPKVAEGHVTDALMFGVPLIPHVIGGLVMVVADRFIIANMLDVQAVGIYTLALQIGMIMGLIADAFIKVYGPWLYAKLKENTDETRLEVVGVTYLVWLVFLALAFVAFCFCELFFSAVVGKEFAAAKEIVFWFFLGQTFKGMYLSVAGFFFFSSRTSNVSVVTVCTGLFSVVITIIFVKLLGLQGAAMAYALSEGVLFVFAWLLSRRIYKMPWSDVVSSISLIASRGLK
ncbi:lipopolysaccharide biosynthesis protein [Pseudomonas sp. PDM04]|jgi:Membrane protein involved in the export of O-antigen and teichoic acid|uniref:lipopolysaccharide biosynthesis protein n=1 Tax=Pseudomonas sp. PDM04 TaxID=2769296 RepID=UPI001782854C|nr:oligosaccharide flippase family protein [Pseudomonas sp. PDM04]MBD9438719.1 oligosaccharide flippase family protein [Pseudomonas sp. PDM04]